MLKLIKKISVNLILIIISIIVLYLGIVNNLLEEVVFWIIEGALIGFAFVYKKNSSENNEFILFTGFKKVLILSFIIITIFLEVAVYTATGWDGLGYAVLMILGFIILISIFVTNLIMRIYYRMRYKQKFKVKEFIKENIIFTVTFIMLSILLICMFFKIQS